MTLAEGRRPHLPAEAWHRRILEALRVHGGLRVRRLSIELDVEPSNIRLYLYALKRDGKVTSSGRPAVWRLA